MLRLSIVFCLVLLAACEREPTNLGGPVATTAPAETTNGILSGEAAYEQYCIGCHETI